MIKRWKILGVFLAVITAALICRTAYIQLAGHDDLSATADLQQNITLSGADSRGVIYDRNGTPIAGANREYIYIIDKKAYDGESQNALNLIGAEEIRDSSEKYRVFSSEEYSKAAGKRLIQNSGAFIMEICRRYETEQPAVHLIGYVNPEDQSGVSGIELQYNELLEDYGRKVTAVADVKGNLLQGYGLKVTTESEKDSSVKEGLVTTLDIGIQKDCEMILKDARYNAAAVVCQVGTGEIIASASTPGFDPANIEEYVGSKSGELINKVTQGEYPPGSVFKIVVAAAALEGGISSRKKFMCEGKEIINGKTVKCNTGGEEGHGEITLEQAFACSCNCAFIQLGQEIGSSCILEMADKLGLGEIVLEGYPDEKSGNLMTAEQTSGAAIANLCIGQGELLTTPLQIAHITSVIANDGKDAGTYIVKENTGEVQSDLCMSNDTARVLQSFMRAVSEYGTGSSLNITGGAGMKTGSAESTQNRLEVVHGWITGFIPAEEPEYVITVFVEDGKSGSGSAGPIFEKIAESVNESGLIEYESDL